MEQRSETNREAARRKKGTSASYIDRDNEARAKRAKDASPQPDGNSGDPADLRTRGDRKGGSTSSSG
jgi:hypothetical protein